jgi:hypothetical protein
VRVLDEYATKRQRKRRMTVNVLRLKPFSPRPAELQAVEPSQMANQPL